MHNLGRRKALCDKRDPNRACSTYISDACLLGFEPGQLRGHAANPSDRFCWPGVWIAA